jgi:Ras family
MWTGDYGWNSQLATDPTDEMPDLRWTRPMDGESYEIKAELFVNLERRGALSSPGGTYKRFWHDLFVEWGLHTAVVAYSITSKASFQRVRYHVDCIRRVEVSRPWIICLVACKSDLVAQREVQWSEGNDLAAELSLNHFFEVSAKTSDNVEAPFSNIVRSIRSLDSQNACGESASRDRRDKESGGPYNTLKRALKKFRKIF